ncbi:hypothetical protein BDA96_07G121000 [Sorghum bicolor]|uniref:Uncharacterized protein n=1 Tax=Sorghum bicolor TaxID=4558 RepID=A0A921QJH7_SORBI|nr:hypothetical protein BDA96_07G121000 [Sorghum bicolor]
MTDVVGRQSPEESDVSAIYKGSKHHGKENDDPNESSHWLHRNDDYMRQKRPPFRLCQTESSNGIIINSGGYSNTARQLTKQNWYLNMDAPSKEKLLQERREYKKAKAEENKQQSRLPLPRKKYYT